MPPDSACDLRGARPSTDDAGILYVATPVRICRECSSSLAPAHEVCGRVYKFSGLRQVVVTNNALFQEELSRASIYIYIYRLYTITEM